MVSFKSCFRVRGSGTSKLEAAPHLVPAGVLAANRDLAPAPGEVMALRRDEACNVFFKNPEEIHPESRGEGLAIRTD
jgi:hypothetical protein